MDSKLQPPGLILFAHGARDARWAEPFQRVAMRIGEEAPELLVELAFLDFIAPDLPEAARRLAARGASSLKVVPLFLGPGGHLRAELPALAAKAMNELPGIRIEIEAAAGEDAGVVAAMAGYALRCAKTAGN